jgi:1-acyl-sn-glycerol-3-phosphate acyltransferase
MSKPQKSRVQQVPPEIVEKVIESTLALDEKEAMSRSDRVARVMNIFARPTVVGGENIPEGPVLYIGNHSTMALDVLVAMPALQKASGRFVRGMNDAVFYQSPRSSRMSISAGGVLGNAQVGDALFEAGKDILLFPGGAYEANKDLDQRYTIQWKQRTGFVRMAAKHGVPIVPVGIVGPDEWFGRYLDRGDVRNSWLGRLMRKMGASEEFFATDQVPVIPRGIFGTLIPRPQRTYICVGEPISTAQYKGKAVSQASQDKLRDLTRDRLEECIAKMLLLQAQQRDSGSRIRRLLSF